jgi:hypothetical protein
VNISRCAAMTGIAILVYRGAYLSFDRPLRAKCQTAPAKGVGGQLKQNRCEGHHCAIVSHRTPTSLAID